MFPSLYQEHHSLRKYCLYMWIPKLNSPGSVIIHFAVLLIFIASVFILTFTFWKLLPVTWYYVVVVLRFRKNEFWSLANRSWFVSWLIALRLIIHRQWWCSLSNRVSGIIPFMYVLENRGDSTHPCRTPVVVTNESVSPSDFLPALRHNFVWWSNIVW